MSKSKRTDVKVKHENREQWLAEAVEVMKPHFKRAGYDVPKVRVSCGWPSSRGLNSKKAAIGECWDKNAAEDKVAQIFISPRIKQSAADVLPVLAHEVCHAVVGNENGHNKVFGKCARGIGLTGKLTATVPGPEFLETATEWVKQTLGEYPHAALRPSGRPVKKQTTRMIKCECEDCGYTVRTSRKWLEEAGAPLCPCNSKPMAFDESALEGAGEEEGEE